MLRSLWRPSSILRNGSLGFVLAIGMALSVAGPSSAGIPSRTRPRSSPRSPTRVRSVSREREASARPATRPGWVSVEVTTGSRRSPRPPTGSTSTSSSLISRATRPCDPASGNRNRIYIQVSGDGGNTWGAPHLVADTVGGVDYPRQVDCVVTVDSATGAVYVSFLIYCLQGVQTDVAVAKSTDFGQTFTAAKVNGPECANCDHPWTVAYGNDVYTAHAHAKNQYLAHARMADRHGRRPMSCAKTSWPSRRARSWTAPTMHGSHGGTARLPAATAIRRATTGCRRLWPEPRTRPSRWCPQRRPVPNARTRRTAASLISASRTTSPSTPPATC